MEEGGRNQYKEKGSGICFHEAQAGRSAETKMGIMDKEGVALGSVWRGKSLANKRKGPLHLLEGGAMCGALKKNAMEEKTFASQTNTGEG